MLIALLTSVVASAGVFPYEVESKTLDNGLEVLVVPMPTPGVAAIYTWIEVGSRNEVDDGRTGFAHFFEHLMFYGTETVGKAERAQRLTRTGAEENAWTWLDETVYHAVLSTDELPGLITLEADRFQHLALAPGDVQRESGAVYGEFRKSQASPGFMLSRSVYDTAFQVHTYGHSTIGHEADIAAMPSAFDYSQTFFQRWYRPENARVILAGDVDPAEVFTWIEEAFGPWANPDLPLPEIPQESEQTELRRTHVAWDRPTAPRLTMAWKIPGAGSGSASDLASLQLVADLLGSPTGPLETRLVREESLAYSVDVEREDFVDPCLFAIHVQAREPDELQAIEGIIRETVSGLAASVDSDLIERTRSHTRYSFLTSLDSPSRVASTVGWHARRGGLERLESFYAAYDQVDQDAVGTVVDTYLVDDGLTVGTLTADEGGK